MTTIFLIVFPSLVFTAHVHSWPASWTLIDTDPNENGPNDDWRDVKKAYYQYDNDYLYLKLECHGTPGSKWGVGPDGDGRYKWFIDLEGNMYFSGGNWYDAEYLLFVEDTDEDAIGEMYLLANVDNNKTFNEYEPWPNFNGTSYANYEVTNTTIGDWRIVSKQMEMYISWNSIGNPSSFWITWATDQENPNLDQGPSTDHDDDGQPTAIMLAQYTLTVNVVGSGSVNRNDSGPYSYGDVVELTAVPDAGWSFANWSGDLSGSANPETITMDANKTVTATFTQILVNYTLTVTHTIGGTTNPSQGDHVYPNGTNVTVTANPDACYVFDHWELDGSPAGSANPITVHMDGNHTLHAVFTKISYTLTILSATGGSTSPSQGVYVYPCSTDVQVTANPNLGYTFDHWELDGSPAGSANPIPVHMDTDHTLRAVFRSTPSIGGTALPIDIVMGREASHSLFSQIGLASVLSAIVIAIIILVRRRNKAVKH